MNFKAFVPNALTLCNLLCGSIGVILLFLGNFGGAGWCVFIAAVFDVFDGMIARLLGVSRELGKELDSLSDVVSFGLLPSLMALKLLQSQPLFFDEIAYLPLIIVLASSYRLAKFNIDTEQKKEFLGMPTPANAIFWASLCLYYQQSGKMLNPYLIIALVLVLSFLLVCRWKMFSIKTSDWSWHARKIVYIYALVSLGLIIAFGFLGVSIAIIFYPVFSYIHYAVEVRNLNKI